MSEYILYLDESETFTTSNDVFFAIGGVIIEKSTQASAVSTALDNLKKNLWTSNASPTQIIIHEKEVSQVQHNGWTKNPNYKIFRQNRSVKELYNGLSKILKDENVVTMGVCISISELTRLYPGETNPKLTIAIQMLFENYCHFLIQNNAVGDICYEALDEFENQKLRQRFYELKALGTMYYTPHCFQTRIGTIEFASKSDNKSGLQLADFIPNTFARMAAAMSPKNKGYKKTVLQNTYNGGIGLPSKYGLKIIP